MLPNKSSLTCFTSFRVGISSNRPFIFSTSSSSALVFSYFLWLCTLNSNSRMNFSYSLCYSFWASIRNKISYLSLSQSSLFENPQKCRSNPALTSFIFESTYKLLTRGLNLWYTAPISDSTFSWNSTKSEILTYNYMFFSRRRNFLRWTRSFSALSSNKNYSLSIVFLNWSEILSNFDITSTPSSYILTLFASILWKQIASYRLRLSTSLTK